MNKSIVNSIVLKLDKTINYTIANNVKETCFKDIVKDVASTS